MSRRFTFKKASLVILFLQLKAFGQTFPFSEVWSKINSKSAAQQASILQEQAFAIAENRSERHWLPRLYVDVKGYQTNDPGSNFFGLLEQRQVQQSDFAPDILNHPNSETFIRGAVGIDVLLYEGGAKLNQKKLYGHAYQAQQFTTLQVQIEQYAEVAEAYAGMSVLNAQSDKLFQIKNEIEKLIKNYQIGQKSNPVGYSGLLGMKSLSNRIAGLIEQYRSQLTGYNKALISVGWDQENWNPEKVDTVAFVETYLNHSVNFAKSNRLKAGAASVQSATSAADMEKARSLPRLGAFAESYGFKGSRDTSNGYTAGLYLQWNLYDPSDTGRYSEARLKSLAAEKQMESMSQQEAAEFAATQEAAQALRINLKLLDDSDKLLNEQMHVAMTLFKNGSITALQLVEILNRRADLVTQQNELQLSLIKNASRSISKTDFTIPFQASSKGL